MALIRFLFHAFMLVLSPWRGNVAIEVAEINQANPEIGGQVEKSRSKSLLFLGSCPKVPLSSFDFPAPLCYRPSMEGVIATQEPAPPSHSQRGATTDLSVAGMTCNNCVRHVTQALQSVPGVRSVDTQLETGTATVRWKPDAAPKTTPLLEAVQEAGYKAAVRSDSATGTRSKWSPPSGWRFNVYFGTAVTLPL